MTKTLAYKGFNSDWTCRDFQYEVGKTYTHEGEAEVCKSGFHACTHPLDCFSYYEPGRSRFAVVEYSEGAMMTENDGDTKVAGSVITIKAEIQLGDMIEAAVKSVFDAAKWLKRSSVSGLGEASKATGYRGAASATGVRGAASATGYSGAASATGDSGAASATGYSGAASATGVSGAASATGYSGAASATGVSGAASATGYRGAASATGVSGAASATGVSGAASATGVSGAASATGDRGAASATGVSGAASATGAASVALAAGYECTARASEGSALFLVERDLDGSILSVFAGIAGQDGLLPDTPYSLRDGVPVEAGK